MIPPGSEPFSFPIRVSWEDTDASGGVYHASYLRFLERARTEWVRAQGIEQQRLRVEGDLVMAVREMRIDFLKPAKLDDELRATMVLLERRRASFLVAQELWRDNMCLLRAQVRIACLRASDFSPRALPSWLAVDPSHGDAH
ncbi:tol-pal system-associated acyl-CoA thioesterase [soil metagenome]